MTDVNHLQEATDMLKEATCKQDRWEKRNIYNGHAIAHALIAIAEDNKGLFAAVSAINSHLAVIAEQLEKMNYKGHRCSSCNTEPVERNGYLCDTCLDEEDK